MGGGGASISSDKTFKELRSKASTLDGSCWGITWVFGVGGRGERDNTAGGRVRVESASAKRAIAAAQDELENTDSVLGALV